jgi:hypothetical protein
MRMGKRAWRRIALCTCFSVWLASCGTRAGIAAEADTDDDFGGFDAGKGRPCGYGMPCNPKDLGGRTCESLGLKGGDLSCDPNTCNLVLTKCETGSSSSGTGGANGSTGSPTDMGVPGGTVPGLFGTAAGSGGAPALFGAGFFGPTPDGGVAFFGGQNPGMGFFGNAQGNDEDGGTDNGGGNPGFFGAGFFGAGNNNNGGN